MWDELKQVHYQPVAVAKRCELQVFITSCSVKINYFEEIIWYRKNNIWKYDRDRNSVWNKNSRETMHNIKIRCVIERKQKKKI